VGVRRTSVVPSASGRVTGHTARSTVAAPKETTGGGSAVAVQRATPGYKEPTTRSWQRSPGRLADHTRLRSVLQYHTSAEVEAEYCRHTQDTLQRPLAGQPAL